MNERTKKECVRTISIKPAAEGGDKRIGIKEEEKKRCIGDSTGERECHEMGGTRR